MTTVLLSPAESNRAFRKALQQAGVRCLTWPCLQVDTASDQSQLRDAIENLFGYDWLILKNARAAEYFLRSFFATDRCDGLDDLRVLTVGSQAAKKAAEFQVHVDISLPRFGHNDVYREVDSYLTEGPVARLNILMPSANVTREAFATEFEDAGARVDSVTAYRTTDSPDELTRIKALLAGEAIDFAAFTDASELDEFGAVFDSDSLGRLLNAVSVICINEATRKTASEFGLSQTLKPSESSLDALYDLLANCGS